MLRPGAANQRSQKISRDGQTRDLLTSFFTPSLTHVGSFEELSNSKHCRFSLSLSLSSPLHPLCKCLEALINTDLACFLPLSRCTHSRRAALLSVGLVSISGK